jgi:hypothetical protein
MKPVHKPVPVTGFDAVAATVLPPRAGDLLSHLLPGDWEMFAGLRIPKELVGRAGIMRVTDTEARAEFGIKGGGDMSGLAYPYFEPASLMRGIRRRWYVRIRRDHPDPDGKRKYMAPYGDKRHFYFPPCPEWFADPSVPIHLVEAEKSSLAMLALCHRTGRKLVPIALGGCWSWRGKVGIATTANGERVPQHDVLPDLGICREGRKTFVMFDVNVRSNAKVAAARAALVRQLCTQGADVAVLDLPAGDRNG